MLVTNALPATATRADWSFAFVRSCDPAALSDGTLTVTENTGKRVKRTVTTTYAVQETPCRSGRSFLLVKEGHAGNADLKAGRDGISRVGEVYAVTLIGGRATCTCKAGSTGRACKHAIALRWLVETADLPSPLAGDSDHGDAERQPPVTHPAEEMV